MPAKLAEATEFGTLPLTLAAPPGGLEPPTVCLEGSCSIR